VPSGERVVVWGANIYFSQKKTENYKNKFLFLFLFLEKKRRKTSFYFLFFINFCYFILFFKKKILIIVLRVFLSLGCTLTCFGSLGWDIDTISSFGGTLTIR
jgi:hypothetical protein